MSIAREQRCRQWVGFIAPIRKIRQFYRRWGFEDVPFDPKGSMIVRMVDLGKSGIVA